MHPMSLCRVKAPVRGPSSTITGSPCRGLAGSWPLPGAVSWARSLRCAQDSGEFAEKLLAVRRVVASGGDVIGKHRLIDSKEVKSRAQETVTSRVIQAAACLPFSTSRTARTTVIVVRAQNFQDSDLRAVQSARTGRKCLSLRPDSRSQTRCRVRRGTPQGRMSRRIGGANRPESCRCRRL